jgi:uncharacterized protein (DUF58 family)
VAFTVAKHPLPVVGLAFSVSLLLLSIPAGRMLQALEFHDLAPGRVVEGEQRSLDLVYSCPGRFPLAAVDVRSLDLFVQIRDTLPLLPPGRRKKVGLWLRGGRRGRVLGVPLDLTTTAPFGLLRHHRRVRVATDLWVLPQIHTLRESVLEEMLLLRPRGLDLPQPTGPGDGEFYALREFRDGDPERRVHHRLSARTGRKVLRIFRGEAPPQVQLVLDPRVSLLTQTFQQTDFEEAVRFTVGIVRSLLLRNVPVTLFVLTAREPRLACSPRCRDLYAFLASLAQENPVHASDPDLPPLPAPSALGGRRVLVHLGLVREDLLPRDWISIQAGSRKYYRLLEPRFLRTYA